MTKLYTKIDCPPLVPGLKLGDRILVLGSCFADSIGQKLIAAGFDACVNPFGTLYNPASVASAIRRLSDGTPFTESDCVPMGSGAGKICSWFHHTSFARESAEEFLSVANGSLEKAQMFWKSADVVIVTLGTAMVWKHDGTIVSNCLKRPAGEFTHEMLSVGQTSSYIKEINLCGKRVIYTVSPIRHMGADGARVNNVSKSTLQLALYEFPGAEYFPSYEIMMDELRDYRFYAADLVHPNQTAVDIIWERFLESAVDPQCLDRIRENEKAARRLAHRSILNTE